MKEPIKIFDLSRKQLAVLLHECFYIIGKKTEDLDNFQLDTMINGIIKYQGSMRIDDFKEAFGMFAAGELEVKIFGGASPIMIGSMMKVYKEKKYPKSEPIKKAFTNGLPVATDEDYYNSLIHAMNGTISPRRLVIEPNAKPSKGNIIPMDWEWEAVYNHLKVLTQVDDVSGYEAKKKQVLLWLNIKYPSATNQVDLFKESAIMKGKLQTYGGKGMGTQMRETLGL